MEGTLRKVAIMT
ncbi:hypothetical protein A2U01_0077631, partial [Trifolium medium]|nr:hypothetical protein [Trifolium medium]